VVAFQELAAGGNVVKDAADFEIAARLASYFALGSYPGVGEPDLETGLFIGCTGLESDFCDCCDGRQGFAAEAVSGDAVQVVGSGDLAGGVTLEAETGIVGSHPASVVDDLDESPAGVGNDCGDVRGAGVDGVFHQFLDDRCGTLYDFACCYKIGYLAG